MDKKDLIAKCRYYKGENKTYPQDISDFVKIERLWVEKMLSNDDMIPSCYTDYVRLGLTHFCENDGVVVSLKAFLCNRFMQYNDRIDVDAFKSFYKSYMNSQ